MSRTRGPQFDTNVPMSALCVLFGNLNRQGILKDLHSTKTVSLRGRSNNYTIRKGFDNFFLFFKTDFLRSLHDTSNFVSIELHNLLESEVKTLKKSRYMCHTNSYLIPQHSFVR